MQGKFVLSKTRNKKFMFNLKASNGQVILTSERYETKKAAENGIKSVRKNAGNDKRFERKASRKGEPYFVLKAANGEPIGKSEMYKAKQGMENGVKSVAKNAPGAKLVDETA